MGNNQSAPAGKQANKLSKPRTNSSPTNLLAPSTKISPVSSARTTPVRALDAEDEQSRSASAQPEDGNGDTHAETLGRESNDSFSSRSEEHVNDAVNEVPNVKQEQSPIERRNSLPVRDLKSRASTGRLKSPCGDIPHTCTMPLPQGVDESTRLFRDMRTKPSDDELTTMLAEGASRRSASISPIRRRSLRTPGIATRDCVNDILRKQPVLEAPLAEESSGRFRSESQSSLDALNLAEPNVFQTPRTITPCGIEYSHLGGLRPGTLVITNGAASPASGSQTPRRAVSSEAKGEYSSSDVDEKPRDNHAPLYESPLKAVTRSRDIADSSIDASKRLIERLSSLETQQSGNHGRNHGLKLDTQDLPVSPLSEAAPARQSTEKTVAATFQKEDEEVPSFFRAEAIRALEQIVNRSRDSSTSPPNGDTVPKTIRGRPLIDSPVRTDSGYVSQLSFRSIDQETKAAPEVDSTLTVQQPPLRAPPSPPVDVEPVPDPVPSTDVEDTSNEPPMQETIAEPCQSQEPTASEEPIANAEIASEASSSQQQAENSTPDDQEVQTTPSTITKLPKNAESSNIPPVPSDVAMKHKERLERYPALNHLQHTFPSLDYSGSQEDFTNTGPVASPPRFPSPSSDSKRPGIKKSKSLFSFSRKQKPVEGEVIETNPQRKFSESQVPVSAISDFGTVARSLGHSPYDIAMSGTAPKPRQAHGNNSQTALTPFRISTAMPRQKRVAGMTEEAASALYREQALAWTKARSKSFSRPRSIHGDLYDWGTGSRGSGMKPPPPVGADADAPPVPALPAVQNAQAGAGARKSLSPSKATPAQPRPTSMVESRSMTLMPPTAAQPLTTKLRRPNSMYADIPGVSSTVLITRPPRPLGKAAKRPLSLAETLANSNQTSTSSSPSPSPSPCPSPAQSGSAAQGWEAQERAWAERRKSLGNSLPPTTRSSPSPISQLKRRSDCGPVSSNALPRSQTPAQLQRLQPPRGLANAFAAEDRPHSMIEANTRPPAERPLGRYEGGLYYDYEPGRGIGGSAGTRGLGTQASRKSIHWSLGYGIDLSDVPIFVQPGQ